MRSSGGCLGSSNRNGQRELEASRALRGSGRVCTPGHLPPHPLHLIHVARRPFQPSIACSVGQHLDTPPHDTSQVMAAQNPDGNEVVSAQLLAPRGQSSGRPVLYAKHMGKHKIGLGPELFRRAQHVVGVWGGFRGDPSGWQGLRQED